MPTPFPLADNLLLEDPDAPHAGRPDPIHANIEMGPLAPRPSGIALAEDEMSDQAVADDGAEARPAGVDGYMKGGWVAGVLWIFTYLFLPRLGVDGRDNQTWPVVVTWIVSASRDRMQMSSASSVM